MAKAARAKYRPRIYLEEGEIKAIDNASISLLSSSFFGERKNGELVLNEVEALYLVNAKRCECVYKGRKLDFPELFSQFANAPKLFTRFCVYRDWRDRGIFLLPFERGMRIFKGKFKNSPIVEYPSHSLKLAVKGLKFVFDCESCFAFLKCEEDEKKLFTANWFGQLGAYKQHEKDKILKLNPIEVLFLAKHGFEFEDLNGRKLDFNSLLSIIKKRIKNVDALLDVYSDWRERGYVIKTGFKFGTHFRLYFPGASPVKKGKWIHSKHVVHVFPKETKLLMSEWARAVRVAHGVRKTFIMAVPLMRSQDYEACEVSFDYLAWWRSDGKVEKPNEALPKFAILALSEDSHISGKELAAALDKAHELGLQLVIAIVDRETSVTYYVARRIMLKNSRNHYYEIEWFQP